MAVEEQIAQTTPENSFKLIVHLPSKEQMEFVVLPTTTIQEIKQVVYDSAKSKFLTCFYLSHKNQRVNDVMELGSIEDFEPILTVIADVYTEHEARVHVNRVREVLTEFQSGVSGYAIDQGISFCSAVGGVSMLDNTEHTIEQEKKTTVSLNVNGNESSIIQLPAVEDTKIECLSSLGVSIWNPPPLQRKMQGDFFYMYLLWKEINWKSPVWSMGSQ
jgi:protein TIF31